MDEPANALELIERLKQKNGRPVQKYKDIAQYLGFKARDKGIPVHGQFELTPFCNFNCSMCYVHLKPDQLIGKSVLTVDVWKELIYQAWKSGMLMGTLTGGECLAYPGFEELFLFLHQLGCEAAVLTNGYLLDENRIQFFKSHKPTRIQVTLYGWNNDVYERVTGCRAFDTVTQNIRKAIEAGLPVSLNVTPSSILGEDVLNTVKVAYSLCKEITVNSSIFSPREETGRAGQKDDPEFELYLRIYQLLNELNGKENKSISEERLPPAGGPNHECNECGLRCGGGRSGFVIDWKGTMIPCNRMEMIRGYPLIDGFKEAWSTINKQSNEWPRVPECDGCAYNEVCSNCAGNMIRYAKPGEQPYQLCEQTRKFVQYGVRHVSECDE